MHQLAHQLKLFSAGIPSILGFGKLVLTPRFPEMQREDEKEGSGLH